MQDSFLTIGQPAEGLYKEKGSKFIGLAFPVKTEDEVKERLEETRKTYYDARHHCYAYILGHEGTQFRANDDGEPNHSAGDPILGQIRSKELTNTLVIVVRYFGGTKLGVSGLINAYKTAAALALDNTSIEEKLITQTIKLQFPYEEMNEAMKLVNDFEMQITRQEFEMECSLEAELIVSKVEEFENKVILLQNLSHAIQYQIP
ncbi:MULTISPECIES: YigZ family protein [Roseivirga]|uniref:IMPACT family protein n=1 Tax=Roseivirga TaxID=290180 RepID=UPI00257963B1|nr:MULTISPECIES: YigZ family protein [Roseivirga]|tara:strand:- start:824 stop:1435 length:612 start_codon:yes stop_codon:yes gene_type:complete